MEKTRITTLEEHQALLKSVFDTAKSRVLVVSPFISDTAIRHDNITGMVSKAVSRGVAVELFIDDALNCTPDGTLKESAHNGIVSMLKSGAKVTIVSSIHHKTLIRDNDLITDGSFNWLSAVRQKGRDMQREERTVVNEGVAAAEMINTETIFLLSNKSAQACSLKSEQCINRKEGENNMENTFKTIATWILVIFVIMVPVLWPIAAGWYFLTRDEKPKFLGQGDGVSTRVNFTDTDNEAGLSNLRNCGYGPGEIGAAVEMQENLFDKW